MSNFNLYINGVDYGGAVQNGAVFQAVVNLGDSRSSFCDLVGVYNFPYGTTVALVVNGFPIYEGTIQSFSTYSNADNSYTSLVMLSDENQLNVPTNTIISTSTDVYQVIEGLIVESSSGLNWNGGNYAGIPIGNLNITNIASGLTAIGYAIGNNWRTNNGNIEFIGYQNNLQQYNGVFNTTNISASQIDVVGGLDLNNRTHLAFSFYTNDNLALASNGLYAVSVPEACGVDIINLIGDNLAIVYGADAIISPYVNLGSGYSFRVGDAFVDNDGNTMFVQSVIWNLFEGQFNATVNLGPVVPPTNVPIGLDVVQSMASLPTASLGDNANGFNNGGLATYENLSVYVAPAYVLLGGSQYFVPSEQFILPATITTTTYTILAQLTNTPGATGTIAYTLFSGNVAPTNPTSLGVCVVSANSTIIGLVDKRISVAAGTNNLAHYDYQQPAFLFTPPFSAVNLIESAGSNSISCDAQFNVTFLDFPQDNAFHKIIWYLRTWTSNQANPWSYWGESTPPGLLLNNVPVSGAVSYTYSGLALGTTWEAGVAFASVRGQGAQTTITSLSPGGFSGKTFTLPVSGNISLSPQPGPTNAPQLAQTSAGGGWASTTFYVKYTYTSSTGETLPSPENSLTVSAGYDLYISAYANGWPPAAAAADGITGINIYASTTAGAETLQVSCAFTDVYINPSTLTTTGATPPTQGSLYGYFKAGMSQYGASDAIIDGNLSFSNPVSNMILFNTAGVAAPTYTNRSLGTKIVLYPAVGSSFTDYALGIQGGTLWQSVPNSGSNFYWYAGTSIIMSLTGAGNLTTVGNIISEGTLQVGSGTVSVAGDIGAARTSSPTTGVIYLGNSGSHYLYFDGTNYQLSNGGLYIGGLISATSGSFSSSISATTLSATSSQVFSNTYYSNASAFMLGTDGTNTVLRPVSSGGFTYFENSAGTVLSHVDNSGNYIAGSSYYGPTAAYVAGTITASTFAGTLSGNASTATTATNQSGGTVEATNVHVGSNTAINSQGAYLQWNRSGGDGATWLVNQQGGGGGGIYFGHATTSNSFTQDAVLAQGGALTLAGSLTATTGGFSGGISATTGSFSSGISATTGSFSSTVSSSTLTATGQVKGSYLYLTGAYINFSDSTTNYIGYNLDSGHPGTYGFWAGNAYTGIVANGVTNLSDISLKENIIDTKRGLETIMKLKPRDYNLKLDKSQHIGYIAQELIQEVPEIVQTLKPPEGPGLLGINYFELIPILNRAIQQLSDKCDALETEITALKAKNP